MNTRLIKETRALLPMFAATLPLIVVPQLIWPQLGFGYFALGVACLVMGGGVFGTEFQHRTISLLLSQPIARSVIWREKMMILAAGTIASLAVLLICVAICGPNMGGQEYLVLVFVPLCAFCGAPYWTLLTRQGIVGMVCAVGGPCGILAVFALLDDWLGAAQPDTLMAGFLCLLVIYCAVVYWLGYSKFKQLEAMDIPARELSLPAGLEAAIVAPLTRASARFGGPFATLLKKEFRLHQAGFLLAGVFLLIAVAGFGVAARYPKVAAGVVGGDIFTYALVLPLVVGAIAVAEERGWGITEWHMTLPPSAFKQWCAKLLAAHSISFVLGLLLPFAVFLIAEPLFYLQLGDRFLPSAFELLNWVLSQLLVTSVALYAASFCRTTLQAILSALAMLVGGGGTLVSAIYWIHHVARAPVPWISGSPVAEGLMLSLFACGLLGMTCLLQRCAWLNFRHCGVPVIRGVFQIIVMLLAVWLLTWLLFSALVTPTLD